MIAFEVLKPLARLSEPDPRQLDRLCLNSTTGEYRRVTLEDHYAAIARLNLASHVPILVRDSFETARNLLLYSWFVYRFVALAELHSVSCLEFTLKHRYERDRGAKSPESLRRLMNYAVANGWLQDEGVREMGRATVGELDLLEALGEPDADPAPSSDQQRYVRFLARALPDIRNQLAHGTPLVWPGGYSVLGVVAALISQVCTTAAPARGMVKPAPPVAPSTRT